ETMVEGICVTDSRMRITFVNKQLMSMLGCTDENELIGRRLCDFFDADTRVLTESFRERRRKGLSDSYTAGIVRNDGAAMTGLISAAPLFDDEHEFAGILALMSDVSDRVVAEKQLEALTGRLLTIQDEERRRIARELHDGTA